MDLFNNPMIQSARNAMTPEQVEEYKKIGEYMYNNHDYIKIENIKESNNTDLLSYAVQALKSGLDPCDLSKPEIQSLTDTYGEKWYEQFGIDDTKHSLPKLQTQIVPISEVLKTLSRQERRKQERENKKRQKK